jgi:hypothetical protein
LLRKAFHFFLLSAPAYLLKDYDNLFLFLLFYILIFAEGVRRVPGASVLEGLKGMREPAVATHAQKSSLQYKVSFDTVLGLF